MSDDGPMRFFRTADADPQALAGYSIAVLGYGNLGRSVALNLRDSGHHVVVGNVDDDYRTVAKGDGFAPQDISSAVTEADLVVVLLPDEVIPECFARDIGPHLCPGSGLVFASGYVLAYGLVEVPADVDVVMMSPRMPGEDVRTTYADGSGFFSYISVEQDATGKAWARLLAVSHAVGTLAKGALALPAEREALLDLFVEQTFGAYLGIALQTAFAEGQEAGIPPEALVMELYMSGEMSRTLTGFAEKGFFAAVRGHGGTAAYGGFLRTLEIDAEEMRRVFRAALEDISTGGFAARFQQEHEKGAPTLAAIDEVTDGNDALTAAERRVREALH